MAVRAALGARPITRRVLGFTTGVMLGLLTMSAGLWAADLVEGENTQGVTSLVVAK